MSEKLKRGTRVVSTMDGLRGTVVDVLEDGSYRVYLDSERDTRSFYRSELAIYVEPDILMVHTTAHLFELKNELGVRDDWHEPDEQKVTVEVRGRDFDNAGFWGRENLTGQSHEELHVVLKVDSEPVAMVNLATLFAFATGYTG